MKILSVVGARPNFIKIAPLAEEFKKHPEIKHILVHSGQHYDYEMSDSFFKDLNIPKPDYNLGIGSGLPGWQIGETIIELEKIYLAEKPDLVVVVGDVNSTLAGALSAIKLRIPIAHIEAGLRSFDRLMPEEINRLLTDQIADYLFVTEPSAIKNLLREGISKKKIFYVGNIMIDTLKNQKSKIKNQNYREELLGRFNLKTKQYAVLTLHRPSNVDNEEILKFLFETIEIVSKKIPIIFSVHPRTQKQLEKIKPNSQFNNGNLRLIPPASYVDMICLMENAKFVLTDSGGIQEETTALSIPCLTIRQNTERPITVEKGTNILVGQGRGKILKEVNKILVGKIKKGCVPKYWDGQTAKRIVGILSKVKSAC
jgi:UDP-N-acetylglucosamine 2-epimerase (non-hydrolysing)